MTFRVTAEVPDIPGRTTLVNVESESYSLIWERMDWMKAQGWRVLSAPERVEWPTIFPIEDAA